MCACAMPYFPPEDRSSYHSLSFITSFFKELNSRLRPIGENIELFSLFKISLPDVGFRGEAGSGGAYAHRSALSVKGDLVAISFIDGRIDVVDSGTGESTWNLEPTLSWKSHALPPLVWLEFVRGDSQLLGEDGKGRIWLIGRAGVLDVTNPFPSPGPQAAGAVAPDGCHAVRASCQPGGQPWEQQMYLLDFERDRISSQYLACPTTSRESEGHILVPRSLGFSPDGLYVGAFDDAAAHIWSATGADYMECHAITREGFWILDQQTDRQPITTLKLPFRFHPAPRPHTTAPISYPLIPILPQSDEVNQLPPTVSSLFATSDFGIVLLGRSIFDHHRALVEAFAHPHERLQMSINPERVLVGGGQNVRVINGKGENCAPADLPEVFLPPVLCLAKERTWGFVAFVPECPLFGESIESSLHTDVVEDVVVDIDIMVDIDN